MRGGGSRGSRGPKTRRSRRRTTGTGSCFCMFLEGIVRSFAERLSAQKISPSLKHTVLGVASGTDHRLNKSAPVRCPSLSSWCRCSLVSRTVPFRNTRLSKTRLTDSLQHRTKSRMHWPRHTSMSSHKHIDLLFMLWIVVQVTPRAAAVMTRAATVQERGTVFGSQEQLSCHARPLGIFDATGCM
jgi:hypothetical protein